LKEKGKIEENQATKENYEGKNQDFQGIDRLKRVTHIGLF
jgi:hypothetical protein